MDYEEAKSLMDTHRKNVGNRDLAFRKKLANRTYLLKDGATDLTSGKSSYVITLFDKKILEFREHDFIIADEGFFSVTTHKRLNEFMPRGFRVHGTTAPWLRFPVGFVTSPVGVFPYAMPMNFSYDGVERSGLSRDAGKAFHCIPDFVDLYLRRLLDRVPCHVLESIPAFDMTDSQLCAKHVLADTYIPKYVRIVVEKAQYQFGDIPLAEVVNVLLAEGHTAFKRMRDTAENRVQLIEWRLLYKHEIKPINKHKLRAALSFLMRRDLVKSLGFDEQEWNRR